MSLKLVKIEPRLLRIILIAAALICLTATWFSIRWNFANALAWQLDPRRPESILIADWITQVAPDDPQGHLTAALLFEKTFDPADLARSLNEFEKAVALSPDDYVLWLNLAKARSLNGDAEGAGAAYRRILELAPNYSAAQWAYGNFLIRQGETDEGFALIAKAAASDAEYSRTATAIALQVFDGDLTQIRQVLGDTEVTNAALTSALAGVERFDDSFDAWSRLPAGERATKFKELGVKLARQFAAAKHYHLAARVSEDISESEKPVIGEITNGGFENGVKLRNADLFEWQVAEGAEPQVGLSETLRHSGKYGLFLLFNSFETAGFRQISQTLPVVPGAEYEFELFYRSDIKTTATLKWEIDDAATGAPIASTAPLVPAGDWIPLRVRFILPAGGDGIIIRLIREGCNGPSCPTSGKIAFDDLTIKRL